jgi:hypothetical protein
MVVAFTWLLCYKNIPMRSYVRVSGDTINITWSIHFLLYLDMPMLPYKIHKVPQWIGDPALPQTKFRLLIRENKTYNTQMKNEQIYSMNILNNLISRTNK